MIISDAFDKETARESAKTTARHARVVVLGEFSAGKSTLINLLTGGRELRTQVTATQMPAVWMSYGSYAPYRIDLQGNEHPVDLSDPSTISTTDTAYVRLFMKTPVLELCDLIDTPGNSDPNIAAIAWERVAELADVAVWCSPSTQAWRQSELAAWNDVPERVRERSILLLTRADKLTSSEDRAKVLKRVTREAGDLFSKIHMVSLLEFAESHNFLRDLIELCQSVEATQTPEQSAGKAVLDSPTENAGSYESPDADSVLVDDPAAGFEFLDDADAAATDDLPDLRDDDETVLDDAFVAFSTPEESKPDPVVLAPATPGYATALWLEHTADLSEEDADDLDAVFEEFLAKLDREFAMLAERAALKAAG